MRVGSKLHVPAASPLGTVAPPQVHVHCTVGWERTLVGLDTLEKTKTSCYCWGLSYVSSAIPYTHYTTTAPRIPSRIVKFKGQIKATSVTRRIIH